MVERSKARRIRGIGKMSIKHQFVVCAYKESVYLEECIISLKTQTVNSSIIITTSTPNSFISGIADQYDIPLYVSQKKGGIAEDWNFGYAMADADVVTIAHQDDIYENDYVELILNGMKKIKCPLIIFTDYGEIREGDKIKKTGLLRLKRLMLLPLRVGLFQKSKFVRRRILSFGSPISCPTVSYYKHNLPEKLFEPGFRSDLDWQAWEKLSLLKGSFIYVPVIGMYHRIHRDSETTKILKENKRCEEDYQMFCKFWPRWLACLLKKIYQYSERFNHV